MKGSIVSGTVTVAVVIASTIIVVNVISPTFRHADVSQSINQLKQDILVIDAAIREVASESAGSSRQLVIDSKTADFLVSGTEDKIRFRLEGVESTEPGVRAREGSIVISGGQTMDAYEKDINSDGTIDLVLENEAVLFAVKKITSGTVNMSNAVTLVRNKRTNTDIVPLTRVVLNDIEETSYGTGFSELTSAGDFLTSSSIRIHVVSAGGFTYDVVFAMSGASDFISAEIKNVVRS